ncbi:MAG TPA: hypothetical protein VHD58_01085 [Mycobacteriales bacterium]|nr:hypothetical protein [Mycobacteriales bacterium]
MTAEKLRELRLPLLIRQDVEENARRALARVARYKTAHAQGLIDDDTLTRVEIAADDEIKRATPRGRGRPETRGRVFLEALADTYSDLVQEGVRDPVQMIADHLHYAPDTVHKWIGKARREGLLAPAKRGRTRPNPIEES